MRTRGIIAVLLILAGIVWTGQGLGLFPGSGLMDDDIRWAAAGIVLVVVGLGLGWTVVRRRPGV